MMRSFIALLCQRFLLSVVLACAATAPVSASILFNATSENQSTDISAFGKWTRMLALEPEHFEKFQQQCANNTQCDKQSWEVFLHNLQGQPRLQQVQQVNSYINNSHYVRDMVNWGAEDYWETVFEFFNRRGDCEDYAIAKYFSLKKLGFTEDMLRIVVLNDANLGVLHSVLAVYVDGRIYILDNQTQAVLEDKQIHHYQPIYAINAKAWWRYIP